MSSNRYLMLPKTTYNITHLLTLFLATITAACKEKTNAKNLQNFLQTIDDKSRMLKIDFSEFTDKQIYEKALEMVTFKSPHHDTYDGKNYHTTLQKIVLWYERFMLNKNTAYIDETDYKYEFAGEYDTNDSKPNKISLKQICNTLTCFKSRQHYNFTTCMDYATTIEYKYRTQIIIAKALIKCISYPCKTNEERKIRFGVFENALNQAILQLNEKNRLQDALSHVILNLANMFSKQKFEFGHYSQCTEEGKSAFFVLIKNYKTHLSNLIHLSLQLTKCENSSTATNLETPRKTILSEDDKKLCLEYLNNVEETSKETQNDCELTNAHKNDFKNVAEVVKQLKSNRTFEYNKIRTKSKEEVCYMLECVESISNIFLGAKNVSVKNIKVAKLLKPKFDDILNMLALYRDEKQDSCNKSIVAKLLSAKIDFASTMLDLPCLAYLSDSVKAEIYSICTTASDAMCQIYREVEFAFIAEHTDLVVSMVNFMTLVKDKHQDGFHSNIEECLLQLEANVPKNLYEEMKNKFREFKDFMARRKAI